MLRVGPGKAGNSQILSLRHDVAQSISTAYRYLHEGIEVIAEQAPELQAVLDQARRDAWSHLSLDGTLIVIDRVDERYVCLRSRPR